MFKPPSALDIKSRGRFIMILNDGLYQFDGVAEGDFLLLIEKAEGFLEVFLAAIKGFVDILGIALVGERHLAIVGAKVVEDAFSEVIDTHFLDFGKGDINFAVGTHLLDESRETVTDIDILIGLVLVNLSPMGIVDNDTVSQVATLHHEYFHLLTVVVFRLALVKELGNCGAGNDTLTVRV